MIVLADTIIVVKTKPSRGVFCSYPTRLLVVKGLMWLVVLWLGVRVKVCGLGWGGCSGAYQLRYIYLLIMLGVMVGWLIRMDAHHPRVCWSPD